jgi:hypothetical protein
MPLDRMDSIKVVNRPFIKNNDFIPDDYFKDIVGVTRPTDATVENIEIKIDVERAPYLLSKPLHHSQVVTHRYKDGSAKLKWHLIIIKEMLERGLSRYTS